MDRQELTRLYLSLETDAQANARRQRGVDVVIQRLALEGHLRADSGVTPTWKRLLWAWPLTLITSLILALFLTLGAGAFTPPGRAATGWVANIVVGEPGGHPTLGANSRFDSHGGPISSEPIVLATAHSPDGEKLELVGWKNSDRKGPCFGIEEPGLRSTSSTCPAPSIGSAVIELEGSRFYSPDTGSRQILSGRAQSDVASVKVRFSGGSSRQPVAIVPATLLEVPAELSAEVGADPELVHFVAFISGHRDPADAVAIAYDGDGAEIGRAGPWNQ